MLAGEDGRLVQDTRYYLCLNTENISIYINNIFEMFFSSSATHKFIRFYLHIYTEEIVLINCFRGKRTTLFSLGCKRLPVTNKLQRKSKPATEAGWEKLPTNQFSKSFDREYIIAPNPDSARLIVELLRCIIIVIIIIKVLRAIIKPFKNIALAQSRDKRM